jgi:tRNA(Ile)-lysidine synthase
MTEAPTLRHPLDLIPPPLSTPPVAVALSGGLDSTVLLHRLAADSAIRAHGLRALHVHHGLHREADAWAVHCSDLCATLGVALEIVKVEVPRDSGLGPEGAARQARREAFAGVLRIDECLALAQHRDDQAETFLLRALRASGPEGLAAMRPWRRFAGGWMWRPLLDTPRDALRAYALAHRLSWVEDPSNADTGFDRNFLRHRVLPLLRERWPQADAAFSRAAELCGESGDLLAAQDEGLLASLREEVGQGLSVQALRALAPARRARALRHWVAKQAWPPLPAGGIARIEADLIAPDTRGDRMPSFAWQGVELRRWREALHAVDPRRALPADWSARWDGRTPLALPNGDTLALEGVEGFPSPLRVHARSGGERILLPEREHHHSLKHVLQELDIPPWERARMPLVGTDGGHLLAAGDRVRSAGFDHWLTTVGARLVWARQ